MTDPNIGYDSPFVTIDEDIFGPGIDWPDGRVHAELRPRCPCLRVRPRAVGPRPSLPACQLTPASAWAWSARCATWARRMWTGSWPRRRRSSAPEPCRTCTAAWTGDQPPMARDKVKRNVVGLSGLGLRNCARSRGAGQPGRRPGRGPHRPHTL